MTEIRTPDGAFVGVLTCAVPPERWWVELVEVRPVSCRIDAVVFVPEPVKTVTLERRWWVDDGRRERAKRPVWVVGDVDVGRLARCRHVVLRGAVCDVREGRRG